MPYSSQYVSPLARAGSGRSRLAAYVRGVPDVEWEWSPEDGSPSARDVVERLLKDEASLRRRLSGAKKAAAAPAVSCESPAEAVEALRRSWEASAEALREAEVDRPDAACDALLRIVFAEGAAFGHVAALQRLIDPTRAAPASL
jgi:hypothetical protein